MFEAGRVALVEVDLKKIVALSTLSQLRMILFAVSNLPQQEPLSQPSPR